MVYVGQTKRGLKERFKEHVKVYKHRAKYTIHLIEATNNQKKADEIETYYIKKYDTVKNGENITFGKGTKGLGANKTSFKKRNLYGKMGTKKVQCIETGETFESITECAKQLKLNPSHITAVCKGKRKSTGHKHFKYI